ncbi:hypothetical protein LARV_02217 [Longilinea arvoryzae]|uniref:Cysteinyl-tRNA ligase anticodon binding domain-containing protein n=1 Tax=Longilinea arvoryzae TaxID=360412 RepID=A0A0S7BH26_9CHLR|nr:hypothetical protein [Longilinea arvoryzae]GAP14448.1 hypothetical protein LARV_02217 [Longilinea arvoryzae]
MIQPGRIALIGSGETAARGGQAFDLLARQLTGPLSIAVMETPAGFELNSTQVASRVAAYMQRRLQNYGPSMHRVAARRRGAGGTDDWETLLPLLDSNLIFMGPGSPSYTVRQLKGSLAWDLIRLRNRLGAALATASAATAALGALAIPVYEIYKVGEDPHWKPGLNLLGDYDLECVIVPHWNNTEGGADIDTGRCFIGRERFEFLRSQLPENMLVLGVDEHSGLIIDWVDRICRVTGRDAVHILHGQEELDFSSGQVFPLEVLGDIHLPDTVQEGIDPQVWEEYRAMEEHRRTVERQGALPKEIAALLQQRQQARDLQDWVKSDQIRDQAAALGWKIIDTPDGQQAIPE